MSKEVFLVTIWAAAIVALFLVPGAFDMLFAFVFIGMVPFTHYTLPPLVMLAIYALLIALLIRWLFVQPVLIPDTKRRESLERSKARRRVLKKTKVTQKRSHSTTAKRRRYQQAAKA